MPSENGASTQEFNVTKDIPLSTERKSDYFKVDGAIVLVHPSYDYHVETGIVTGHGHDDDHNLDTIGIKTDIDYGIGDLHPGFQTNFCGLMTREDYDYLHANPNYTKDWVNKHNRPNEGSTDYDRRKNQENVDNIINAIINKPLNLSYQENKIIQKEFDISQKEATK